jgi:hypothetical protein
LIRIDPAVSKVADEQIAGEATEPRRRLGDASRRVEPAELGDTGAQLAIGVERVNDP